MADDSYIQFHDDTKRKCAITDNFKYITIAGLIFVTKSHVVIVNHDLDGKKTFRYFPRSTDGVTEGILMVFTEV